MASELEEEFVQLPCGALRRVTAEQRRRVFPYLEARQIAAGQFLYRFGEVPPALFIILSGEVLSARKPNHRLARGMRVLDRGHVLGEAALMDGASLAEVARAEGPVVALVLRRARYEDAARAVPELRQALEGHARLQPLEGDFFAAMQRTRLFQDASPHRLFRLFEEAELVKVAPGEVVLREGEAESGVFFIVEGELHSHRAGAADPALVDMLFAGDVFGDLPLVTGEREPTTVTASSAAMLLRLPAAKVREVTTARMRKVVGLAAMAAPEIRGSSQVLLLQTDLLPSQLPAPLGVLTDLLGQTLRRDHHDPVLVIRLVAAGGEAQALPELGDDEVARLRLPLPDGNGAALAAVHQAIETFRGWLPSQALRDRPAPDDDVFVLLDVGDVPQRLTELRPIVTRLVQLSRNPLEAAIPRALQNLPTTYSVLLDGALSRAIEPAYQSRAVRVRLDREPLAAAQRSGGGRVRLTDLPVALRSSLSRWGRAATDRRVGIALGGGGAWGYAHVALIEAMLDRGIPIDLVSGASFGSVVGAYYCADGRAGLEQLVRDGWKVEVSVQLAMLSSRSLAMVVDRALGTRQLEDLEVPLLPVATDVASGTQYLPTLGTLGYGVRASGSFPGIFTPTTTPTGRFVDGGMINNVPDSVLHAHGAFLAVASNIVASPLAMQVKNPPFGDVGRFLYEFNPLGRVRDLVRSLFIMFHTTGDRQALFADVTYESSQVPFMPWQFSKGAEILDRARPGAAAAADRARKKWEALRGRSPATVTAPATGPAAVPVVAALKVAP